MKKSIITTSHTPVIISYHEGSNVLEIKNSDGDIIDFYQNEVKELRDFLNLIDLD